MLSKTILYSATHGEILFSSEINNPEYESMLDDYNILIVKYV
uniref:Uncharacterized protein n=1 Tax=viral metagenome TaxID=1070528 RepID=A0A6C0I5S3_9ZZZZ